jgi:hypothetical protein
MQTMAKVFSNANRLLSALRRMFNMAGLRGGRDTTMV